MTADYMATLVLITILSHALEHRIRLALQEVDTMKVDTLTEVLVIARYACVRHDRLDQITGRSW